MLDNVAVTVQPFNGAIIANITRNFQKLVA